MDVFNRGDTAYLLLNYQVNGEPMVQGAYKEIELQINKQDDFRSLKKLLSKNEIFWGQDFIYQDSEGVEHSFTGYVCALTQDDTFKISSGASTIQIRVLMNNEVGSSSCQELDLGCVLSDKVLE